MLDFSISYKLSICTDILIYSDKSCREIFVYDVQPIYRYFTAKPLVNSMAHIRPIIFSLALATKSLMDLIIDLF